jgi:hypothetical protein
MMVGVPAGRQNILSEQPEPATRAKTNLFSTTVHHQSGKVK